MKVGSSAMQGRAEGAGAPAGAAVAHQVFTAVRRAGGEEPLFSL